MRPTLRSLEEEKRIGIQKVLPKGKLAMSPPPRDDATTGSVDRAGKKNGAVYVAPHLTAKTFTSSNP